MEVPSLDACPVPLTRKHTIRDSCEDTLAVIRPCCCPICNIAITKQIPDRHYINSLDMEPMEPGLFSGCSYKTHCLGTTPVHGLRRESFDLEPLVDILKARIIKLQVAICCVLQDKDKLTAGLDSSIEQVRTAMSILTMRVQAYGTNTIAAAKTVCADRIKSLEAQADESLVSAGQAFACATTVRRTLDCPDKVGLAQAMQYANAMTQLCDAPAKLLVPARLGIASDSEPFQREIENMIKLVQYDIDNKKSGIVGKGLDFATAKETNTFQVIGVDHDGNTADWIKEEDISIRITDLKGYCIGRLTDVRVVGPGQVRVQYMVDDGDAEELFVHVRISHTNLDASPWRVGVVDGIRLEASHTRTMCVHQKSKVGLAVTLDGLYVAVSNLVDYSVSVYSADTGECISTFGGWI
jgi:hypothetical protein